MQAGQRVEFANTLRGFAAIAVLISHYFGVFWLDRASASSLANAPELSTESHGVPAYVIFHDATLREIAMARPDCLEDLGHLNGVGVKKLESYGESILACIAEFAER
jgi:superfamily II DNA helicase RecQ